MLGPDLVIDAAKLSRWPLLREMREIEIRHLTGSATEWDWSGCTALAKLVLTCTCPVASKLVFPARRALEACIKANGPQELHVVTRQDALEGYMLKTGRTLSKRKNQRVRVEDSDSDEGE